MIPGSNLLEIALQVIAPQAFRYYAFIERVTNSIGLDIASYAEPMSLNGSVQPVPRSMMDILGLDMQKNYINVFVSRDVIDIGRDVSGDYLVFGVASSPGPFEIATDDGFALATDADGETIITDQGGTKVEAKYQCISATKWSQQDGWCSVLAVQVP